MDSADKHVKPPDWMDQADSKVGAYPNADERQNFGTLYMRFGDRWETGKTREACWPAFVMAIGIAKANADEKFKEKLPDTLKDLTLEEMAALMWEAYALTSRLHWWTWREDDREELVMP